MRRRGFLKAAAAVPAAALAAGRVSLAPVEAAGSAAQPPAAAAADVSAEARAMYEAMKAMLGRTYTADEEQRVMRRLEGVVRQNRQMAAAGLKNGDEPVTMFAADDGRLPDAPIRRHPIAVPGGRL